MYESFFGLTARPFAAVPSAACFFPGTAIETARQTLTRCIERAEGCGLLTGPAGTGKSLLCQVLAAQFADRMSVALLASGRLCTRRALLQAILFELGLPYRGMEEGDLRLSLIDHLSPRGPAADAASAAGLLLIFDEAHTLPLRLMEELRLITNFVRNGQPRVRLVLSGGPQLEERFASPKLESFNQRVAARCYLESLDRLQTVDYVRYQIDHAQGAADKIFTGDALDAVYHATDGIPRLINQVCDHALILACAGGVQRLTASGIEEAWSDLQQLPTPWNASQGAATRESSSSVVEFGNLDEELMDEPPAALPFRGAVGEVAFNSQSIQIPRAPQMGTSLDDVEDDFQPLGSIGPEVELVFQPASNPFLQSFDEEEVVIDRYTTIELDALANRPLVRSVESQELAALLAPFTGPSKPAVAVAPATWPGGLPAAQPEPLAKSAPSISSPSAPNFVTPSAQPTSAPVESTLAAAPKSSDNDDDLIVIEEPAERVVTAGKPPAPRARRKEYRQLFAQLRRG